MNTSHKTFIIYSFLLLSLLASSCSIPAKSEIDTEAENVAQQWWERTAVKCGEDYFANAKWTDEERGVSFDSKGLFQLKNASYKLRKTAEPLTEASRLNGLEWAGEVEVQSSSHRRYYEDKKEWGGWGDGVPRSGNPFASNGPPIFHSFLEKSKGRWHKIEPQSKPNCSELPK
jgi:hypothetical protein